MLASYYVLSGAAPLVEGSEDLHAYVVPIYEWIPAGAFNVEVGFFVDPLTACLLIVVTTIGLLVHIYSIGYMGHDPGYWRFFAYLNLFMFSMLLLVLADSWLVVFVAWELVGLCSYLLIGFWFTQTLGGTRRARRRSWSTAWATSASRSGSWRSSRPPSRSASPRSTSASRSSC